MTAAQGTKRRRWLKFAAAITVVWIALTVGERWSFQRMFDVPPEFRQGVFFSDLPEGIGSDISPLEAHLLWVIRDPDPADGTFHAFARNFVTMLCRASPFELPVVLPVDLLMSVTGGESLILIRLTTVVWIALTGGESFTLIKLIAIVAAGLVLAMAVYILLPPLIAAQVRRHRRRPTLWPLLFGGLFVCAVFTCFLVIVVPPSTCSDRYPDDIDLALDAYLAEQAAGDPVITIFEDDSRFAHFAATRDLRLDNRIDLSQREFSTDEIDALIASMDDDRIWVLFERGAPHLDWNVDGVFAAVVASGRGIPFLRGPILPMGMPEKSDHWVIFGYDANSRVLFPRGSHPPYCL